MKISASVNLYFRGRATSAILGETITLVTDQGVYMGVLEAIGTKSLYVTTKAGDRYWVPVADVVEATVKGTTYADAKAVR